MIELAYNLVDWLISSLLLLWTMTGALVWLVISIWAFSSRRSTSHG